MKYVSWNVNGLRAVMRKGFDQIYRSLDADVLCLQETKLSDYPEGTPLGDNIFITGTTPSARDTAARQY